MRILVIYFLSCLLCSGASYFVATDGSDAADGTTAPWLTIQKALNTVAAGDDVTISNGLYGATATTKTSGTAASPITLLALPGVTMTNLLIVSNAYYVVNGFYMTGVLAGIQLYGYGTNCHDNAIISNRFEMSRASVNWYPTINWNTNAASTNLIAWNTCTNNDPVSKAIMGLSGSCNLVTSNTFINMTGADAIDFLGLSNRISRNFFTGVNWGTNGNHVDMFQAFSLGSHAMRYCTIDNNVISNCLGHFSDFNDEETNCYGILIYNNVTVGGWGDASTYIPGTTWLNNTFHSLTSNIACIWFRSGTGKGGASNSIAFNNIASEVKCNSTPIADDVHVNNVLDYNFTSRPNGLTAAVTYGAHAINGGFVGFVNTNAGAIDLRLLATSRCVDAGTNLTGIVDTDINLVSRPQLITWDMGAYEFVTNTNPAIARSPAMIDFGEIKRIGSVTSTLIVSNAGTASLDWGGTVGTTNYSISPTNGTLAVGNAQSVTVTFQTTLSGVYTDTITLTGGGGAVVSLTGTSTNFPTVSLVGKVNTVGKVTLQ